MTFSRHTDNIRRRYAGRGRVAVVNLVAAMLVGGCTEVAGPPDPVQDCAEGRVHQLAVGEVIAGSRDSRGLCLEVRQSGEYVLIPFVSSPRDTLLKVDIVLSSTGVVPRTPEPVRVPSLSAAPSPRSDGLVTEEARAEFDAGLRDREAALFRTLARPDPQSSRARMPIHREAALPAEGSTLELNVAARCDATNLHGGRVAAVSGRAIVLADTANPLGGFSDADYRSFAADFDSFVYPRLTAAFGEPTDIDGNDRVLLFFTRAVNEITPPGGTGVIAGYFWGGDVFPRQASNGLGACPASNEAEILYLAVPDPNQQIRPSPITAETLRRVTLSTVGHEFQHLVNTSRRLHVNGAESVEEKWLNEGLSFMAEELLFFGASGLTPRQNIGVEAILASSAVQEAFKRYAEGNLGRLNIYLQGTHRASPLGVDDLSTRGAAWAFLRYVADRDRQSDEHLLHSLANSTQVGLANLETAIGTDPLEWMRDWSIAIFTDDLVPPVDPRFAQPSWNHRQLIASLRMDGQYPIRTVGLDNGESTLTLPAGGSMYTYFAAEAGSRIKVQAIATNAREGFDVLLSLARIR